MNSGVKREVNENLIKRRIAPGVWMDQNNALHFELPSLLAAFDLPDTQENRDKLQKMVSEVVLNQFPNALIKHRENPPDYKSS